jgi:hypothetical protein
MQNNLGKWFALCGKEAISARGAVSCAPVGRIFLGDTRFAR